MPAPNSYCLYHKCDTIWSKKLYEILFSILKCQPSSLLNIEQISLYDFDKYHLSICLAKMSSYAANSAQIHQINNDLINIFHKTVIENFAPIYMHVYDLCILHNANNHAANAYLALKLNNCNYEANNRIEDLHHQAINIFKSQGLEINQYSENNYSPHISIGIIYDFTPDLLASINQELSEIKGEILWHLNQNLQDLHISSLDLSFTKNRHVDPEKLLENKKFTGNTYLLNSASATIPTSTFELPLTTAYETNYDYDANQTPYETNYGYDTNQTPYETNYDYDANQTPYETNYDYDANQTPYETNYGYDTNHIAQYNHQRTLTLKSLIQISPQLKTKHLSEPSHNYASNSFASPVLTDVNLSLETEQSIKTKLDILFEVLLDILDKKSFTHCQLQCLSDYLINNHMNDKFYLIFSHLNSEDVMQFENEIVLKNSSNCNFILKSPTLYAKLRKENQLENKLDAKSIYFTQFNTQELHYMLKVKYYSHIEEGIINLSTDIGINLKSKITDKYLNSIKLNIMKCILTNNHVLLNNKNLKEELIRYTITNLTNIFKSLTNFDMLPFAIQKKNRVYTLMLHKKLATDKVKEMLDFTSEVNIYHYLNEILKKIIIKLDKQEYQIIRLNMILDSITNEFRNNHQLQTDEIFCYIAPMLLKAKIITTEDNKKEIIIFAGDLKKYFLNHLSKDTKFSPVFAKIENCSLKMRQSYCSK